MVTIESGLLPRLEMHCTSLQEMHEIGSDWTDLHTFLASAGHTKEIGFEMAGRRGWLQLEVVFFQDWYIIALQLQATHCSANLAIALQLHCSADQEIALLCKSGHCTVGNTPCCRESMREQAGAPSCKDLVPFSWRARVTIGKKIAPYGCTH